MDELRIRRAAAPDNRESTRRPSLAERPDRIALWAVALAVVAMIAGAASARAGSSGGIGGGEDGGTTAGSAATDCRGKDRDPECAQFAGYDWARQLATWYGPGFFGNRTACGQRLTRRTMGVAHKRLPCGSRVVLSYKGRYVRTTVIDRGPFAHGAKWDLTQATARSLGFEYTDDVRVARPGA